ncbi:hypothetical protein [Saccharopolyspora phatthalungensis]|uniref:Uncharacterized protein n=1 Tax=Saccharopolyspora phatthalungensis TaxID=664693 RepID=A0A840Q749_9PSEU|nr:hypothetical protein [Saccharopolyspora phatthalungensis]MBB5156494.1 hypothetical protein [Saccharopolyspora phatthalungensis]
MPSTPNHPRHRQPEHHRPRHCWQALDRVLGDPRRFRRLVVLLLLVTGIVTEPGTLPHLITALVQRTLLR